MSYSLTSPSNIPTHIGQERVHQNEVLSNRAAARRLWRALARRLSAPWK